MKSKWKIILLTVIFGVGCIICANIKIQPMDVMFMSRTYGPLTIKEALEVVRLPIHSIQTESEYNRLKEVYYFFDDQPELRLATYFTIRNQEGKVVRLAEMVTHNSWGGGPGPNLRTDRRVRVRWAIEETGYVCKVLDNAYLGDKISGEPYQTCIYWFEKDNQYQYILHTIWSEAETETFINTLIRVEK